MKETVLSWVPLLASMAVYAAPGASGISPGNGTGLSQTFSAAFVDPAGAANIQAAYIDFGGSGARQSCFLLYLPATKALRLFDDANHLMAGALTAGTTAGGALSNSQCTVSSTSAAATLSGTTLTVPFHVAFSSSFSGAKPIYGYAQNFQGKTTGWTSLGTFTVGAPFSWSWKWDLSLTQASPTIYSAFSEKEVPADALITRLTFHLATPAQSVGDVCVGSGRTVDPVFPSITVSFSQLLCFHALRQSQASPWDVDLDLSATPLYVPASSKISVGSMFTSMNGTPKDSYPFSFAVSTIPYDAGAERYRSLQIPYVDQANLPGGIPPPESIYQSTTRMPLAVEAAALFVSFSTMAANGKRNEACLEWKHGPDLVKQQCFAAQTPASGAWNSPAMITGLGWQVPVGDTIGLKAHGDSTDTQAYVIVKIPSTLTGPQSAFGNYDNIPQSNLANYCSHYYTLFTHPYFKTGDAARKCVALYPPAR